MDTMSTILFYENKIRKSEKKGLEAMSTGLWQDYAHMCKKAGKDHESEQDYDGALRYYYQAADIYMKLTAEERKRNSKAAWLYAREAVPALEKSCEMVEKVPDMRDVYHLIQYMLSFFRSQVVLLNPEAKPDEKKNALMEMLDVSSKSEKGEQRDKKLTKEAIKYYLTRESLRKEELGDYLLVMIRHFVIEKKKVENNGPGYLLRVLSDLRIQFEREGLGPMALAYMLSTYPDVDIDDMDIEKEDAEKIMDDFKQNQDELKNLDQEEQIQFALKFYNI